LVSDLSIVLGLASDDRIDLMGPLNPQIVVQRCVKDLILPVFSTNIDNFVCSLSGLRYLLRRARQIGGARRFFQWQGEYGIRQVFTETGVI
jgi:hypothetical protein